MKILQEETLMVIQYNDEDELKNHAEVMLVKGFVLERSGWRYGKWNAVYKKYVV